MGFGPNSSRDHHLFQVRKAVEGAEAIIIHQLEENNQLKHERDELLRKIQEMEIKQHAASARSPVDLLGDVEAFGTQKAQLPRSVNGKENNRIGWMGDNSANPRGAILIHQNGTQETGNLAFQRDIRSPQMIENGTNGNFGSDVPGIPQFSSPSSLSPNRHKKEVDFDPRFNTTKDSLLAEVDSNSLLKQDLMIKLREHEEEIVQLRKHLGEYSVKEAQIRNENYVLEKRIAYMRLAFDQQQRDLVDAASKALSYRQEIMEENIRLTYALQAAQQEKATFLSSLLPLLSEYNPQQPVLNAQSIVSNLKVLFKHLQEKLIVAENKLKESQYQLAPWHAEKTSGAGLQPQLSSHPLGAAPATSNENSLEIVPQQAYNQGQSPVSSPNAQARVEWDALANQSRQTAQTGMTARNIDQNTYERGTASVLRKQISHETPVRVSQGEHVVRFNLESKFQNPSFKDFVRNTDMDETEAAGMQHERDSIVHWGPAGSPYVPTGQDDPNSYPHLPPVLEEPSSSFSEAAEDDPLPGIHSLQIRGEAFPGKELEACGFSINGTTTCNFEWVRYLEDGSVNYIEGAKQPNYLVTADDIDSYLAIEVQPLDERKRKGELSKVYANDQRKITCDPKMKEQIDKALSAGHESFDLLARIHDNWEQAVLAVKRDSYNIKCKGPSGIVVTEKFLQNTVILIPYGEPDEFIVCSASGGDYLLRTNDSDWSRDAIVRVMRLFKSRALEKRKGKKLFFK